MRDDFAIFICTHGRPDAQLTLKTLRKCGYSGKIYLILDDTDVTIQKYIDNYDAEDIIVFDKNYYINTCKDIGDNCGHYKCILYAKNVVEDIAQDLNLTAFMLIDDDITNFRYRYIDNDKLKSMPVINLDDVLTAYIRYMLESDIKCIGFCGASHYFAGTSVYDEEKITNNRFPYQVYLRNTKYKIDWISWYGEDDITMLQDECLGSFWFNLPFVQYDCVMVGDKTKIGGMVDEYINNSSFKLNMIKKQFCPSQLILRPYKDRFITTIRKEAACIKLISSRYRRI